MNKDKIELEEAIKYLNIIKEKDLTKLGYVFGKEAIRTVSKIINEIQKEIREHIGFENRLKRDNREPDSYNQGRFYVANNINDILNKKY